MYGRLLMGFALGIAVTPAAAAAQSRIEIGAGTTGQITVRDQTFGDGSRYDTYRFRGRGGDTITADLTSDDFDTMLLLADEHGNRLAANDDGGEQCNARLQYVLPAAGEYRLHANARAPYGFGHYRLRLARGPAPASADTTCRHFQALMGVIQARESLHATLTGKDRHFTDSTLFRRYALPVRANQALTIDLRSDDFDSFLLLEQGRGTRLVNNDDGGGGCHARIVYTPKDDRPLVVVVNTAQPHQTGDFLLAVRDGAFAPEAKTACHSARNAIAVGESRTGRLTTGDRVLSGDSTYFQRWQLDGRAGATVTVDLESPEFDTFLFVAGPGLDPPLRDDDSGGSCNARLTVTFSQSGAYIIAVNAARKHATGAYTLRVTPGSTPPSPVPCTRGR